MCFLTLAYSTKRARLLQSSFSSFLFKATICIMLICKEIIGLKIIFLYINFDSSLPLNPVSAREPVSAPGHRLRRGTQLVSSRRPFHLQTWQTWADSRWMYLVRCQWWQLLSLPHPGPSSPCQWTCSRHAPQSQFGPPENFLSLQIIKRKTLK